MPLISANTANFDSHELTNEVAGLTILATNPYAPPKRKLNTADFARASKSKVSSAFYNNRPIALRVGISRATRDLLEVSLDSLLGIIQGREKSLLVRQSGAIRKYTCTFSDYLIREEGGAYLELDLIFYTSDHFGYDNAYTLLLQVLNYASANKTDQISVDGSAPTQCPRITLTLSALTGGTTKTVTIGNGTTGQAISVTRTWAAGDVLEIDSLNQTVKVNGSVVDFTGAFPEFVRGVGYITYADGLTTRTMSMRVEYYRRWV